MNIRFSSPDFGFIRQVQCASMDINFNWTIIITDHPRGNKLKVNSINLVVYRLLHNFSRQKYQRNYLWEVLYHLVTRIHFSIAFVDYKGHNYTHCLALNKTTRIGFHSTTQIS